MLDDIIGYAGDIIYKVGTIGGETFWSTVLGAVIAAITSYFVQRKASKSTEAERLAAILSKKKTLAHSILIKILYMSSDYEQMANLVRNSKQRAENAKPKLNIEQSLLPIANLGCEIHFTQDELSTIFELKSDEIFNSIIMTDRRYNSCIGLWKVYGTKRNMLSEYMVHEKFDFSTGVSEARMNLEGKSSILLFEVRSLAKEVADMTELGDTETRNLLASLVKILNEKLQSGIDIKKK